MVPRHRGIPLARMSILVDRASTSSIECVVRMALFSPFGSKFDMTRFHKSRFAMKECREGQSMTKF